MSSGRTRRRVLIALAALVVFSPVAFLAAYRIVAKRLLSGPALRAEINRKPKELFIDWDEAVSTWPGRVTVKNLRIRGSDPNVQWIVILPQARFRYALSPLLRRTFRVTELRPESVQFRLREKLARDSVKEARVQDLPPIPGFDDPPLKVAGETLPTPEGDPFTIVVEDVATDAFDDIWVDRFRYRGPSKLRGRFRLRPGIRAQIGPASVEFGGGTLAFGDATALRELSGGLEATFADWDVQELLGDKVWKVVTAKVDLAGPTEGVDFLDGLLQLGPGVHVSGGPGHVAISGGIDQGTAAGTVALTAKQGKYVRPGLALVGDADARLVVSDFVLDGGAPKIGGTVLKISNVFVASATDRRKDWWGQFAVSSGRLSKGLTGKVSLKCKDGRPLLAFLGEALPKWTRGLIDLEGLSAAADVVLSQPRTAIRELEASGGNFTVSGEYDRRGERVRGAFLIETGILTVGVELDEDRSTVRPLLARQWFRKTRSEGLVHAKPGETSAGTGAAKSEE